jgi:hypothetical protein
MTATLILGLTIFAEVVLVILWLARPDRRQ